MATRTVTLTGRVTDKAGHATTKTVTLTVNTPDPLILGYSPNNSTTADLTDILGRYPNPKLVRLYSGVGEGIAAWTDPVISMVPNTAVLWYSFKDWDATTSPQQIRDWLTAKPAARADTRTLLTLDHEPEQQDAGDPTPAQFRQEWQELVAALANHPRRGELWLVPIFTEYNARRDAAWWADFGVVASYTGVDAIGFDVYDTGYERYRTTTERNDFMLSQARRVEVKKPLVIGEWGIKRKPSLNSGADYDLTGSLAAQAMRDQMTYLRQQPDVAYVSWFYRGFLRLHTTLTYDGTGPHAGETYVRDTERAAFVDLLAANP